MGANDNRLADLWQQHGRAGRRPRLERFVSRPCVGEPEALIDRDLDGAKMRSPQRDRRTSSFNSWASRA
jgi:hypothetical protein